MLKAKKILYSVVLLIGLIFAQSAIAARQVPGSIPEAHPLIPIPINANPNVSGNIQSGDPAGQTEQETSEEAEGVNIPGLEGESVALPIPIAGSSRASTPWILVALGAIIFGAGIGYWLHAHKK